jgi:hypothetical protein
MTPTPPTKCCQVCHVEQPLTNFYLKHLTCKSCRSAAKKVEYYAGTSPTRSYDANFAWSIKRLYGMTMAEYEALLAKQAHRCAVCRRPETKLRRNGQPYRLGVDHDHVTKTPRALLCHRCNMIVWALEENHTLIPAIVAYVEQFRASVAGG